MYEQEYNMVFTDSALWAGLVIYLPCQSVCVSVSLRHPSHVTYHNHDGKQYLQDKHIGKEAMKNVLNKKYLGSIFTHDMKNSLNIKEKTDRGVGIVNKILSSIYERPYGEHTYKAAIIMREAMLIGSMLTNSESWINLTQQDLDKLQKPDTILQRKLLSEAGNSSKVFMLLELGILPVRYVIIMKRLNFLRYILGESTTSMIGQVYSVLKEDGRNGDFVNLVQSDLQGLEFHMTDHEIQYISKSKWIKIVKTKVIQECFKYLVNENSSKEKN